ncbi:MAG: hypothetical protein K2X81_23205, partial [Candidatus Obscuribacterales bacterium]|nr:hypothetical protein [Candidatus Obscuribacterales bacterium]MBY0431884.1 hypothetical protein [Rhodospirillales bacterium]
ADFRSHVLGGFIEPLLGGHDAKAVEIFCYSQGIADDAVTRRCRAQADHWRDIAGKDDAAVAEMIRADGLHVLEDLSCHTAGNRLGVFARKPAPVQVTHIGAFATTGLDSMDYWITDGVLHPPDTAELAAEAIWRLRRCWVGWRPPADAPDIAPPPSLSGRPVTFGSFNNLAKLTPRTIALWSRVLAALPGSRLLLKDRKLQEAAERNRLHQAFAAHGIAPGRLEMKAYVASAKAHLELYNDMDLALDPVPCTGAGTTVEALWMGVPVVTLAGSVMLERQGASLLAAIGRGEWITGSEDGYVALALSLAHDGTARAALRASQRGRMAASELCDERGFAAAVEAAYRTMWEKARRQ